MFVSSFQLTLTFVFVIPNTVMIGHLFQSPALISFRLFRNTLSKILGNTNRISCAFSRVLQKTPYDFSTVYFRATLNSNFPTSFALFIFQCTTAVSKTAYLVYHKNYTLSSTFFNFFKNFLAAHSALSRVPIYLTTISLSCQQNFKHFLTFETIVQSNFKI